MSPGDTAVASPAVRTRTLLLLAVACGLAILVAGVVQLLRIANQDEAAAVVPIGQAVRVGDMSVTVEAVTERPGSVLVDVEIGGVDDADGSGAFRLNVSGELHEADGAAGNHCGATTVQIQPCTLAFRVAADAGSSRVLLYQRGDERVRWDLAPN
jgi:hypothetical protein